MRQWWAARARRTKGVLIVVGVLIVYAGCSPKTTNAPENTSVSTSSVAAVASATPAVTTTPTPVPTTATPRPSPTPFNFGSGKKLVPTEVPPGTYRMRTAAPGCYWERLSGLGGTFGEIIANGNPAGPEIITIAATDKAFNSTRCAPWSADLSAITSNPSAPFGQGTYVVGVDIAPGTWRSSGGTSCYWQRMSGFDGGFGQIIANENAGDSTIVTIGVSDKAFSSMRCGTWTKIG